MVSSHRLSHRRSLFDIKSSYDRACMNLEMLIGTLTTDTHVHCTRISLFAFIYKSRHDHLSRYLLQCNDILRAVSCLLLLNAPSLLHFSHSIVLLIVRKLLGIRKRYATSKMTAFMWIYHSFVIYHSVCARARARGFLVLHKYCKL